MVLRKTKAKLGPALRPARPRFMALLLTLQADSNTWAIELRSRSAILSLLLLVLRRGTSGLKGRKVMAWMTISPAKRSYEEI